MSRIGYQVIEIPEKVEVTLKEGNVVAVKGPKGELSQQIDPKMEVKIEDNEITIERASESKRDKSIHGLTRSLINNMIVGVTEGYEKKLIIEGTGYRAQKQGNKLVLNLGYSHPIEIEDPEGITVEAPKATELVIQGADKQKVGAHAAVIRDLRKPEPYKGKGIRYSDEIIRRKVGKAGS